MRQPVLCLCIMFSSLKWNFPVLEVRFIMKQRLKCPSLGSSLHVRAMLQYKIHLVYFEIFFKTWEVILWVPWQIVWFNKSLKKAVRDKQGFNFLISDLCSGWKQKAFCSASDSVHFCSEIIIKIRRLAHIGSKHILSQMASVCCFSAIDVLKVFFWFTVVYVSLSKLFLHTPVCTTARFLGHRQLCRTWYALIEGKFFQNCVLLVWLHLCYLIRLLTIYFTSNCLHFPLILKLEDVQGNKINCQRFENCSSIWELYYSGILLWLCFSCYGIRHIISFVLKGVLTSGFFLMQQ